MENIKEYLTMNLKDEKAQQQHIQQTYNYELILNNGVDFIIRRTTNQKHQRDLVFILNDRLLYIRTSNGDEPITTRTKLKRFFDYTNIEDITKELSPYWHKFKYKDDFTNELLRIIKDDSYTYEFLKHRFRPHSIQEKLSRYDL